MGTYIKSDEFIEVCYSAEFNIPTIVKILRERYPNYRVYPSRVEQRIQNYRRKGWLPLDSGNSVSSGEVLKGTSTLYDESGAIKLQWVKSDVPKEQFLEHYSEAITELASSLPSLPIFPEPQQVLHKDLATLYVSNDLHLGALMWDKESGTDWNLDIAYNTVVTAYDYLFETSPSTEIGIICDLGDLMEVDNQSNTTPKSGNVLSVDSRYPKILQTAYKSLIYAVEKALVKHKLVYFYNVEGNHDLSSGHAIREIIRVAFKNNPRVIIDSSPSPIKYHKHGTTLLGFAHGDGLKMQNAGEVMAVDNEDIFSFTKHRFFHFGHVHRDAVIDSPICRCESHRNLAPLNHWAFHKGYRRQLGTMKSITYHNKMGEISRSLFNLN
jgi:hypothetical protein